MRSRLDSSCAHCGEHSKKSGGMQRVRLRRFFPDLLEYVLLFALHGSGRIGPVFTNDTCMQGIIGSPINPEFPKFDFSTHRFCALVLRHSEVEIMLSRFYQFKKGHANIFMTCPLVSTCLCRNIKHLKRFNGEAGIPASTLDVITK